MRKPVGVFRDLPTQNIRYVLKNYSVEYSQSVCFSFGTFGGANCEVRVHFDFLCSSVPSIYYPLRMCYATFKLCKSYILFSVALEKRKEYICLLDCG